MAHQPGRQQQENECFIGAVPGFVVGYEGFIDGLWLTPLPFELDPSNYYLVWHARRDRDPGVIWMRDQIEGIIKDRYPSYVFGPS